MTLLDLAQHDTRLKRVSSKEWRGACPLCGGDTHSDRFIVWPDRNRYWCRQCHTHGDRIQYLRDVRGLSYQRAAEIVGKGLPVAPVRNSLSKHAMDKTRALYQQWEARTLDRITDDYWRAWDRAETIELEMALALVQAEPATADEWDAWQRRFDRYQQDGWAALEQLAFFQHPATMPERVSRWEDEEPSA